MGRTKGSRGLQSTGLSSLMIGGSLIVAACSSSPQSGFGADGGAGQGFADSDGGGELSSFDASTDPASLLDSGCAQSTSSGQRQPLDIYIMLDQSGSMADDNKWQSVTGALTTFVNQPSLAGVGVGIQYFAVQVGGGSSVACPSSCTQDSDCGSGGVCIPFVNSCVCQDNESCDAADYAKPEIEITDLPGGAAPIVASIAKHGPYTGTPTSAALQGAIDHASAWSTAHKGHTTIVLLATDGAPEDCDTDLSHINAIAQKGFAATPSVRTYVIGVGDLKSALDGIASAGGTGSAFIVDASSNTNAEFLAAMNKIRGQALGCQYDIPTPDGGAADFSSVNVVSDLGGGKLAIIPNVAGGKSACPATGDAWYYDNETDPTAIILCDQTCSRLTAVTTASLSVVTGCSTNHIQ